jgi:integrase
MKTIATHVEDYLTLRRGLGFKLGVNGYLLRDFAKYCAGKNASHITTNLALKWAVMPKNIRPEQRSVRLGMVRVFTKHLAAIDPRTEIPPNGLLPRRKLRSVPCFYREDQVATLIHAAETVCKTDPFKGLTCSTLFGLLAATGMRVGEALGMKCDDVNLEMGVLSLRATKHDRKRLVPLHSTVTRKLAQYYMVRTKRQQSSTTAQFFVTSEGNPLPYSVVNHWFLTLARRVGLRDDAPAHGLRLHDLRHYFAVRTLLHWYKEDIDVEVHLPELSTYLGHCHVTDTYWFLSAVPELLQLAAQRWNSSEGGPL